MQTMCSTFVVVISLMHGLETSIKCYETPFDLIPCTQTVASLFPAHLAFSFSSAGVTRKQMF